MTEYDKLFDEHVELNKKYQELSDKYVKQSKDYADLILAQSYGVIFTWTETNKTEFFPIFSTVRGTRNNLGRPNHFQLNFDQSTLAEWITQCNSALGAVTHVEHQTKKLPN